ncbi:hypothetical protein LOK49_LG14G01396 [Camellia lanceoleosa]|uniref:Uncharacterized protein n=1 Tax=Camellia lanceoleosa TaxID=1840588 RepID=A0ACC0F985_9ERIC|nr:hypothetical protein LOK49_LG14G01396 [Camellia lanceoleosa]
MGFAKAPSLRHFRLAVNIGASFRKMGWRPFGGGLLPSTLMSLGIENLPNLKSLNNKGLQLLGSLKYMKIEKCPRLNPCSKRASLSLYAGILWFSGYVYPKEVLLTALEGSASIVQMILYVSQVLRHYKWPEYLETDFVFNSSPIGSVTAQFLAAFSTAFVKTSVQFSEFEESDPDDVTKRNRHRGKRKAYQHQSADYFHQNFAFEIYDQTKLLKEQVLSRYKWPEYLETDFVFSSSSIGSVTAQFLAAFFNSIWKDISAVL